MITRWVDEKDQQQIVKINFVWLFSFDWNFLV